MTKGILGRKIGMTQVFAENGELIPVTVVEAGSNVVLQKKTIGKEFKIKTHSFSIHQKTQ